MTTSIIITYSKGTNMMTIKSRSSMLELIQELIKVHLLTKFGNPSASSSRVIWFRNLNMKTLMFDIEK